MSIACSGEECRKLIHGMRQKTTGSRSGLHPARNRHSAEADCANPATNRQADWGAQRRSCTSVAELRRESSCHSQDSERGVD